MMHVAEGGHQLKRLGELHYLRGHITVSSTVNFFIAPKGKQRPL